MSDKSAERSDPGAPIWRHTGRKQDFQLVNGDEQSTERIEEHLGRLHLTKYSKSNERRALNSRSNSSLMRYLVHLLPTTNERAALDQLRSRIAAQIGHNAALRYPTAHITLIYEIQDRPEHDSVIEPEVLKRILHTFDGRGAVLLEGGSFRPEGAHILRRFDDPPNLRTLREDLYARIRDSGAGPNGELQVWAQAIKVQTGPHLTLVQDTDRDRQGRAMEIVRREGRWIDEPIRGGELALLAWIREGGPDYEIIHRVTL